MITSDGLVASGKIIIPANQGLVGRGVRLCDGINVKEPSQEIVFFYEQDSQDEMYLQSQTAAFCIDNARSIQ